MQNKRHLDTTIVVDGLRFSLRFIVPKAAKCMVVQVAHSYSVTRVGHQTQNNMCFYTLDHDLSVPTDDNFHCMLLCLFVIGLLFAGSSMIFSYICLGYVLFIFSRLFWFNFSISFFSELLLDTPAQ